MELILIAVIGGILLGVLLLIAIWKIVSRAVENGLDWLIHTFGNEAAAKRIEEKWQNSE